MVGLTPTILHRINVCLKQNASYLLQKTCLQSFMQMLANFLKLSKFFDTFKNFVKKIPHVNDCAERNIRLTQDFIGGYKSEDMKQNLMLVARDNRKKLKKSLVKLSSKMFKFKLETRNTFFAQKSDFSSNI